MFKSMHWHALVRINYLKSTKTGSAFRGLNIPSYYALTLALGNPVKTLLLWLYKKSAIFFIYMANSC